MRSAIRLKIRLFRELIGAMQVPRLAGRVPYLASNRPGLPRASHVKGRLAGEASLVGGPDGCDNNSRNRGRLHGLTEMRKRWPALVALATGSVALVIGAEVASGADQTKIPTQFEIERALKTRGLPTTGADAKPATSAAAPNMTFQTITFEFGSAALTPASIKTLENLGNALTQGLKDEKAFMIEGHTDRVGSREYNDKLSLDRAQSVKAYLVKEFGIEADKLQIMGKGFTDPANPQNPYAGENRRVVIVNIGG
jgi:outer membrane protein OmpA-like peptidoglycan-associated protein